jgi:antitoxin component of MazEF toxin-antitoxin module
MIEKSPPSEKKLTKFEVPLTREKCSDKEDIKATNSKHHRSAKVRRTVKLPRLKLEDLVSQITEENAHKEISTGPAVGNEIW